MLGTPNLAQAPRIQGMSSTGMMGTPQMPAPTQPRPYSGGTPYVAGQPTFSPTPQQGQANPFAYQYQGNAAYKPLDASSPGIAPLMQGKSQQEQTALLNSFNQSAQSQANQGAQNQLNQLSNAYGYYAGQAGWDPVAGQTVGFQDFQNQQQRALGSVNQNYDLSKQGLQQQYDISLQKNALQKGNNAKDIGSLQAELATLGQLTEAQKAGQQYGADMQNRKLTSDATASGALQANGTRQGFTDIASQLANQLTQTDLNRKIQGERYNRQLNQAQTQAQLYDLAPKDFLNQLNLGLNKLGLDQSVTSADLLDKLQSAKASDRATAQAIMQNVMSGYQAFPTTSTKTGGMKAS